MAKVEEYKAILKKLGANEKVCEEILDYCDNKFNVADYKSEPIENEPFIEV